MSEWIRVCDELPWHDGLVIVWAPDGHNQVKDLLCEAYYAGDDRFTVGDHRNELRGVTHWMPLPEPPEEDENEL